jgi:hypothetical protein
VLFKFLGKSTAILSVVGALFLVLPAQAQLQPSPSSELWTRPQGRPVVKGPAAKSAVKKRVNIRRPVDRSYEFRASESQFNRVEAPVNSEQRRFQQQYTQSRCRGVCFVSPYGSPIPLNRNASSGGPSGLAIEARTDF